jgi:hypothetical protein
MLGSCLWGAHWWYPHMQHRTWTGSRQCTRCMGIRDPVNGHVVWPWAPEMFGAGWRVPM